MNLEVLPGNNITFNSASNYNVATLDIGLDNTGWANNDIAV